MHSYENVSQPAVFVSHGSPMTALENGPYAKALAAFGESLTPKAIVVISAHWQEPDIRVAAGAHPALIYDFGGFPQDLYEVKYDAPGSPELANEVDAVFKSAGFEATLDTRRGWDHGVWVPLRLMFPQASIPVVETSLPMRAPRELYKMGQALGRLRSKGVLVIGSGGLVHNLRLMNWREKNAPVDDWAQEFQQWVKQRVERQGLSDLFEYAKLARHALQAVPTPEHFAPLFPVLGAAGKSAKSSSIFEGIEHGNMSMCSFAMAGGSMIEA
jgi:4,5-DOPA dioxygenase extradiol